MRRMGPFRPVVRLVQVVFTRVEMLLYRRGRQTLGGLIADRTPVLLLTTIGSRTGKRRTTPLLYHGNADGSLVLVAANGGAPWDPSWLYNLRAEVLGPDERNRLWPQACEWFPTLAEGQQRTDRPIQLVRLTSRESDPSPPAATA